MLFRKSSSSKNSPSLFKKEGLQHNVELFNENQRIISQLQKYTSSAGNRHSKINSDNFLNFLEELCEQKLGRQGETQILYQRITSELYQLKRTDFSSVSKMMVFRDIESKAVTTLTELSSILKSIKKYLIGNQNPLTSVCLKIFYSHISSICNQISNQNKTSLKASIKNFTYFLTDAIYHIFYPWFVLQQKRNTDIHKTIKQRLVPVLITQTPEWKFLYPKIIKCLGKKTLKILRDEQPSYFQMNDAFNCQTCPNPFIRTIVNLQELDSHHSVRQKLKVLKQIGCGIKMDILDHQKSTMIEPNEVDLPQQDLLPCLQYCIMKCDRAGIVQSMQYIQMFLQNDQKKYYEQDILDAKGISHTIKSIMTAGIALRSRDTELSIMQTGFHTGS